VAGAGAGAGLQVTPRIHSDLPFTLSVTATATEATNGDQATTPPQTIWVTIRAVADLPTLTVVGEVRGQEDTPVPLAISGALTDTDGSESLSFQVAGIPDGASFHNANSDSLPVSHGQVVLLPAQLAGLQITPPPRAWRTSP